jgi:hypothetical protein
LKDDTKKESGISAKMLIECINDIPKRKAVTPIEAEKYSMYQK